jgi:hypothetical protein
MRQPPFKLEKITVEAALTTPDKYLFFPINWAEF